MAIPHFRYSFAPGFMKLTLEDSAKVKQEIYQLLGCTNEVMYSRRKNSYRDMPHCIYNAISEIFSNHGVQEADVWRITKI